ncbi:MAG: hypothetical protein Q8Q31_05980 [Nanoarchaeota archaeon]|nr:hypothetical protein [Nanoarchaeota archaeon]
MDLFLGIPYCTGDQARFERALREGDLQKAYGILEKMPRASLRNKLEELQRNAVLAIGYGELAKSLFGSSNSTPEDRTENLPQGQSMIEKLAAYQRVAPNPAKLEASMQRLAEYAKINPDPHDLAAKMERLASYEEVNSSVADLRDQLKTLEEYEELGKPEEIIEKQQELQSLRSEVEGLEQIPGL